MIPGQRGPAVGAAGKDCRGAPARCTLVSSRRGEPKTAESGSSSKLPYGAGLVVEVSSFTGIGRFMQLVLLG